MKRAAAEKKRKRGKMPAVLVDHGADQAAMRRACAEWWGGDHAAMAAAIGRSPSTVHHWLSGRNGCGSEELQLVADARGVALESIRYGSDVILIPPAQAGEAPRAIYPGDPGYDRIRGFAEAVLGAEIGAQEETPPT